MNLNDRIRRVFDGCSHELPELHRFGGVECDEYIPNSSTALVCSVCLCISADARTWVVPDYTNDKGFVLDCLIELVRYGSVSLYAIKGTEDESEIVVDSYYVPINRIRIRLKTPSAILTAWCWWKESK